MSELTAAEKQELNDLRLLKKELAEAGWPNKKVTRDNLLMKRMGAELPYRYDPLPPAIYLAIYRDTTNPAWLRALAWVLMNTIAIGRNSDWAVDDYGRALDVVALAAALGWGLKHAEATLLDLEVRGFVKRDPPVSGKTRTTATRRIHLQAYIAAKPNKDGHNLEGVQTPGSDPAPILRCEPYIKKALELLPPELKSDTVVRYFAIQKFGGQLETDAIAGARAMVEQLEYNNWTHAGIKLRDKRKSRAHPAQPSLLDPLKITAGYVQLDLALDLPEAVRIPGPMTVAPVDDDYDVQERQMDLLDAQIAALDAQIDALRDKQESLSREGGQHPQAGSPEAVQPLAESVGASPDLEARTRKKSRVQAPTSLLPSLTPTEVGTSKSGDHSESVSQSPPDGPTKAATQPPKATARQNPPRRAATPPRSTGEPAAAIPQGRQAKKDQTPAESPAPGQHTGLTGTPSVELRVRRTEIARAIPDELAERLGEVKSLNLLRQIDFVLQGAPVDRFATAVAKTPSKKWTSLGLCISLATPIGQNWADGAAKRAEEAERAEKARRKADQAEALQLEATEFAEWTNAEAEKRYGATSDIKLGMWEIEKTTILKTERRWHAMTPAARALEIKHMILADLARGLPTFDEWKKGKAGGAS